MNELQGNLKSLTGIPRSMAITPLSLKNAALIMIGQTKLQSGASGKVAGLVNEIYDLAVDEEFEIGIDWRFATARIELNQHAVSPVSCIWLGLCVPVKDQWELSCGSMLHCCVSLNRLALAIVPTLGHLSLTLLYLH